MDDIARLDSPFTEIGSARIGSRYVEYPLVRVQPQEIKRIIRWAFYILVFSLPFEMPNLGMPLEVTTFTASLFLLTTLLQPRACFRRPPRAFWWFVVYLYAYIFVIIWHSAEYQKAGAQKDQAKLLFLFLQVILMCWAGCNVMREERTAKAALLTLVAACVILAVIHISGIARTTTEVHSNVERFSTFGQNPNSLGRHLAVGLLALAGLAYGRGKVALRSPFLVWPLFALILMAIASTGSRGTVLALGAGLSVFMLGGENLNVRLRNMLVVALALGFCIWVFSRSEIMEQRFESTIGEGSLAKREDIFPAAWGMFLEKPLAGWGPTLNMWELGFRVGEPDHPFRDTHNLLLEVLTVTGVLGAVPLFAGILLCFRAAWRARGGPEGILPLAMITFIMAYVGANLHYSKLQWLILSYALASGSYRVGTGFRSVIRL
jgi:O-antigen ligase